MNSSECSFGWHWQLHLSNHLAAIWILLSDEKTDEVGGVLKGRISRDHVKEMGLVIGLVLMDGVGFMS